jgi:hypothetical protein
MFTMYLFANFDMTGCYYYLNFLFVTCQFGLYIENVLGAVTQSRISYYLRHILRSVCPSVCPCISMSPTVGIFVACDMRDSQANLFITSKFG